MAGRLGQQWAGREVDILEGDSRALDDLAVRSLIARIAHLADTGSLDDYVSCFAADAHWDMPGAPRHGRGDIRSGGEQRRAAGEAGPGSSSRHVVNTVAVQVIGDVAVATSYWQFYVDTSSEPRLQLIGQYDDRFVRTAEGWQLARRRITVG